MVHKSFTVEKFKSDMNERKTITITVMWGLRLWLWLWRCGCGYDTVKIYRKQFSTNFMWYLCCRVKNELFSQYLWHSQRHLNGAVVLACSEQWFAWDYTHFSILQCYFEYEELKMAIKMAFERKPLYIYDRTSMSLHHKYDFIRSYFVFFYVFYRPHWNQAVDLVHSYDMS